ncbi:EAL domain-containing protein [Actinoplanes oblitus]|uniref:EAL domain-containing protein n=1 Tax=Actinoplanes oblitus TaxID=3040509 RepID=A0ABY8WBM7_9ACTN|nr:EAL domain-containing protein [Actinoplanes oblitus]WIM95241.1 EAL domain-containing protein [Actinoplanes oblitus]
MPTRWPAALFGAWIVVLGVLYSLEPALHGWLILAGGLSALIGVLVGTYRSQPDDRMPWWLLAGATGLSGLGAAIGNAPAFITNWLLWLEGLGTALLLCSYPVLAVALAGFIWRRTGSVRDVPGLLDAAIVTSGVALLVWTFVIGPRMSDSSVNGLEQLLPVADLLCLGLLIRLATVPGRLVASGYWLGAGTGAMLIADVFRASAYGQLALYATAGMAALIPSMAELTRASVAPAAETGRGRLALLAVAALAAPTVLMVRMFQDGQVAGLFLVAVLSLLMLMLVLARMAGIMTSHRQALARERALREASAALVSAADAEAVGLAVRTAVAQLLPGDVPHGVVLAISITQSEPLSPEAAAQAAVDRATGTAARLVQTRDVDWAVAVRLTQYAETLRCPMVLQDRPTGDPLVGVLHVGAPTWALRELRRSVEVLAGQVALALERIALSHEVTQRNSEAYFRTLILNTADVITILDEHDRIRYASPSALGVFGADPTGYRLPDVIHPGDESRLAEALAGVRGGEEMRQLDFRAIGAGRTEVLLEMHCRDLRGDASVAGLVVTMRDVTEQRQLERELTHQAFHDAMTGLANRVLFHDRLKHALARGARDGSVVGVLFIDLDDFKIVNDTLGHAVGDQLLIAVAHRIAGALRADDTAARLGGDEFAALVENVNDPGAVEETANRILAALAAPIVTDAKPLHAVASIGITTTLEASAADELLRQADLALYVAKGAGKNQWRRYQRHLHDEMVERLELRSALDHAVNEGHFLLHYQPIVDLVSGRAAGFEALVRWHHPARGVITPDQFIEVAEESGLIVPMGRWVLEEALRTVSEWRRVLPPGQAPYVTVNVSVRQFREAGFVDQVRNALQHTGVPARSLMLEITETLLMKDDEQRIWADLSTLREMGVRIAIDDFGTGYSSLGYLRQRPIDVVKIDKTFIDDMVTSPQPLALVSGIVSLARNLDLTVVAEGIEDEAHRDLLVQLGCPLGQGFLFSSPLGPTEVLAWMTRSEIAA